MVFVHEASYNFEQLSYISLFFFFLKCEYSFLNDEIKTTDSNFFLFHTKNECVIYIIRYNIHYLGHLFVNKC